MEAYSTIYIYTMVTMEACSIHTTHAWVALVRGDETWLGNPSMDMYHLVMTNIAMENPFWMEVLMGKTWKNIYTWAIFHGYVE